MGIFLVCIQLNRPPQTSILINKFFNVNLVGFFFAFDIIILSKSLQ